MLARRNKTEQDQGACMYAINAEMPVLGALTKALPIAAGIVYWGCACIVDEVVELSIPRTTCAYSTTMHPRGK
jgi:hypothetical protein